MSSPVSLRETSPKGITSETKTATYRLFRWKEGKPMLFCKVDAAYRRNKDGDWVSRSVSKTWH